MIRRRIFAHIIDVAIVCFPMILCIVILTFTPALATNKTFYGFFQFSLLFGCFGIMFKDCINGKSIGKRLFRLKVATKKNSNTSVYQLILRNIILPIWYIEAFVVLVLNRPRIGDKLAKTIVCEDKEDNI